MIRVAVTDLEYNKAVEVFENFKEMECLCAPTPELDLAEFIRDNNISHVIIGVDKYRSALYDSLPSGGMIARFGVGHDGVDKALAAKKGLLCSNTPGVLDQSVAECAVGLMLAAARELAVCITDNKNAVWKNRVGFELSGKKLAVIGCGAIGKKTAKIAKHGFNMKISGFDIAPIEDEVFDEFHTDFGQAVKDADFISLHIPDIPATKDFINVESLAAIPETAVLINTARGGILNENALYDALSTGKLKGAALDVFKNEPYRAEDNRMDLRTLPNVIMTPHIGSSTREACERMAETALGNINMGASCPNLLT